MTTPTTLPAVFRPAQSAPAALRRAGLALLCLSLTLTAGAAGAQMYKWTDERGRVNYSNTPPPDDMNGIQVGTVADKVSSYSSLGLAANAPATGDAALKNRVEALEQELAAERQARPRNEAAKNDDGRKAAAEDCARQRRVDCDRPEVLATGTPMVVVAPPRRARPAVVPTVPVPSKTVARENETAPFNGPKARRPL